MKKLLLVALSAAFINTNSMSTLTSTAPKAFRAAQPIVCKALVASSMANRNFWSKAWSGFVGKDDKAITSEPFNVVLKDGVFVKFETELPAVVVNSHRNKVNDLYLSMFNKAYAENQFEQITKLEECLGLFRDSVSYEKLSGKYSISGRFDFNESSNQEVNKYLYRAISDQKYSILRTLIDGKKHLKSYEDVFWGVGLFEHALKKQDLAAIKILLSDVTIDHLKFKYIRSDRKTFSGEEALVNLLEQKKLAPDFVAAVYPEIVHYVSKNTVIKMQSYKLDNVYKDAVVKMHSARTDNVGNADRNLNVDSERFKSNDPFRIFGLTYGNSYTKEQINSEYKKLAAKYHPDVCANSSEIMQKINYARAELLKKCNS